MFCRGKFTVLIRGIQLSMWGCPDLKLTSCMHALRTSRVSSPSSDTSPLAQQTHSCAQRGARTLYLVPPRAQDSRGRGPLLGGFGRCSRRRCWRRTANVIGLIAQCCTLGTVHGVVKSEMGRDGGGWRDVKPIISQARYYQRRSVQKYPGINTPIILGVGYG